MGLLCTLGRHRPEPWPRWNAGYYFTRCRRCGRDLVRTAYGAWHVPQGCKVVWSNTAPENALTADFPLETGGALPPDAPMKLAIEEVLLALKADAPPETEGADSATESLVGTAEAPPSESPPAHETPDGLAPEAPQDSRLPVSRIPDFMEDESEDESWDESSSFGQADAGARNEYKTEAGNPEAMVIRSRP